jgi:hypothetical protein
VAPPDKIMFMAWSTVRSVAMHLARGTDFEIAAGRIG